ncbi:hypothetical protein BF93_05155 [Brachybacterium phenoliresistens]|uniref:Uncharacterized protein n=1 Tax=Brachybacterium phenoliresistens TaxID=396014 RepID=Z9JP02_9MICO|nr:hypothetical protein BF93_05155 [Brachybacterium phenoliresistens]
MERRRGWVGAGMGRGRGWGGAADGRGRRAPTTGTALRTLLLGSTGAEQGAERRVEQGAQQGAGRGQLQLSVRSLSSR